MSGEALVAEQPAQDLAGKRYANADGSVEPLCAKAGIAVPAVDEKIARAARRQACSRPPTEPWRHIASFIHSCIHSLRTANQITADVTPYPRK